MGAEGIPEEVRQFIFEFIDSVEQLEVLLLLHRNAEKKFTAKSLSDEMRTNPDSAELRLGSLVRYGFIATDEGDGSGVRYSFVKSGSPLDASIKNLAESYRIRPYKVLELIFSPMKKARGFAEAFVVNRKKDEDSHG